MMKRGILIFICMAMPVFATQEKQEVEAQGVIESYAPDSQAIVLRGDQQAQPVTVYVTKTTTIFGEDGKPIGATAVTTGRNVRIVYRWENNRWVATHITYTAPAAGQATTTTGTSETGAAATAGQAATDVPTSAVDGDITTVPPRSSDTDGDITTVPPRSSGTDGDITTQPPENAATDGDITTVPPSKP
jgi:hypothetical protein